MKYIIFNNTKLKITSHIQDVLEAWVPSKLFISSNYVFKVTNLPIKICFVLGKWKSAWIYVWWDFGISTDLYNIKYYKC